MPEASYGRHNRRLMVLLIEPAAFDATPEDVRLALEAKNIESRPVWKPMHPRPVFKDAAYIGGTTLQRLFDTGLCLPSGSTMSDNDVDRVCEAFAGVPQGH